MLVAVESWVKRDHASRVGRVGGRAATTSPKGRRKVAGISAHGAARARCQPERTAVRA